jgi:prepilin-type N-terminal cleavage/methylation domain-containing protein
MERRSRNRGFTLVELLVVIAIIGVLVALLLPAVQAAREAARRSACQCSMKQIGLALLNYESARKSFPLASTAPYLPVDPNNVGSPNNRASAALDGDGYSWLVQILPFMEQQALFSQIQNAPAGTAAGKLLAGPITAANTPLRTGGTTGTPLMSVQLETMKCASNPGADESKFKTGGIGFAVGSYVALPSTHYNFDGNGGGSDTGASGGGDTPTNMTLFGSKPGSKVKQLAGDGVIVFWQRTSAADTTDFTKVSGVTQASIRDGTSGTLWFTESREETWTGWMSGYASYVVGADPGGPGNKVVKLNANGAPATTQVPGNTSPLLLGWATNPSDPAGQTALNIGSNLKRANPPGDQAIEGTAAGNAYFYQKGYIHQGGGGASINRWYGPSSAHSGGIVLHNFADGHGKGIPDTIDRNVYLRLISKAGGEVVDESSGGGL